MRKPTICIGENKDANQLRGNCKADQRLYYRYSKSTISLLLESEISSFSASVTVQPDLCRTCSKPYCWFSHKTAHLSAYCMEKIVINVVYLFVLFELFTTYKCIFFMYFRHRLTRSCQDVSVKDRTQDLLADYQCHLLCEYREI